MWFYLFKLSILDQWAPPFLHLHLGISAVFQDFRHIRWIPACSTRPEISSLLNSNFVSVDFFSTVKLQRRRQQCVRCVGTCGRWHEPIAGNSCWCSSSSTSSSSSDSPMILPTINTSKRQPTQVSVMHLFVSLLICLPVCLSFCVSVYVSVCLSICLFTCACFSVCLSVYECVSSSF